MAAEQKLTGYPSVDKPWLKYYSEDEKKSVPLGYSIYRNIYENNKDFPNDTALLYYGKKISYAQMFKKVNMVAAAFAAYGIKEGDNISICLPAVPEIIYSILALNMIGANAALLNPTFTEQQLTDRINETEATLLITINELYNRLEKVVPNTTIKTVVCFSAVNSLGTVTKILKRSQPIKETITWNAFIKAGKSCSVKEAEYVDERAAIMVFSSGTTGASKGIQLSNRSINWAITENLPSTYGFKRGNRCFSQIPVWFSTGIVTMGLVPLFYGVSLMLEPIYDFSIFVKHIRKYQPNYMITATGLVEYLMQQKDNIALGKSWICLAIGGEYAPPKIEDRANDWLRKCGNKTILRKGYGMCECGGSAVTSSILCNIPGTAGIPTPHVVVAAFDIDSGVELQYGNRGEIRVLTPCRMKEYYKQSDETAKRFSIDKEGNIWICTGDMGFVSADGNVTVLGRISDSFKTSNSDTIYLFDIERTLLDIPGIRQCKAIYTETSDHQCVICHISLEDSVDTEKVLNDIRFYCNRFLPYDSHPQFIHFYTDALPVAPSGKLDIFKMRSNLSNLVEI